MKRRYKLDILLYSFMAIGVLGAVLVSSVNASENHNTGSIILNVPDGSGNGVALGLAASQMQMDWATNRLQMSIGVGYFDGESAGSIGLGKKFNKKGLFFNGSVGVTDAGAVGAGAGINFRF